MKHITKIFYIFCVTLATIMILTLAFGQSVSISTPRTKQLFETITEYELTSYENENAPIGITQEYKYTLHNVPEYNGCIAFYLAHQLADVYIDDELVYQLSLNENLTITKSPGYEWAEIYIDSTDEGKELIIQIHPSYKSSLANKLQIYLGDINIVHKYLMITNLPIMAIAFLAIILGIVFIIFYFVNFRNQELDRSISMLGVFSIAAGVWKMCDMTVAPVIFTNSLVLSGIAIIAISLMIVPFLTFIQHQLHKENSFHWFIATLLCDTVTTIIIILQLCGIADLRQTLTVSHIMIIFTIIYIMTNVILEAKRTKLSKKMKVTISCCILCIVGVLIDLIVYYLSGNASSMIFCLLSFLIYASLMGLMSARETKRLIDRGYQAEHFKNLAFHDTLTGLYNRAFYYEFLKKHNVYRENCFLIMLDVNNLKLCNDTMGHDWGDELLRNSAVLIKKAFPIGECIRMGGDEFCVLLPESSEAECRLCLNTFDELLQNINQTKALPFPVSIAYGYANYDSQTDIDFSDTLRRADKMMYQMKMDMKNLNIR